MAVLGFEPVVPGVWRLRTLIVNVYAVESEDGWTLVDTGPPGVGPWVALATMQLFNDVPPKAIVLTHAHFDHASNAKALAEEWNVEVYVHEQERPYVTGQSDYAPGDPTPGGAMSFLSRAFPRKGFDLGDRVRTFGPNGEIPTMPGWRAIHTPGHTQGHVSLFRESDRTLIAGDAFTTTDTDSWIDVLLWRKKLSRAPTPFTPDWRSAEMSVDLLSRLHPVTLAPGHGDPVSSDAIPTELQRFAETVAPPLHGRYTLRPAEYAPDGSLADVPPPVPDPLPKKLAVFAAIAIVGIVLIRRADRD
ncbi:MBL fold metallo-hydrolase [bacterium]|nr:MAG: MBL fold metallo-hydrolase [bacterium]